MMVLLAEQQKKFADKAALLSENPTDETFTPPTK
jgi:hypothetical protein